MSPGIHIVFEGPEAVGKSTQISLCEKYLRDRGYSVIATREPGDTYLGAKLRELLLETDLDIDPRAEALMMAADRAQNVAQIVIPALRRGDIVISDRHVPSSLVYQGVVRGLGVDTIEELSNFARGDHRPDIIICFDIDDEVAKSRMKPEPDRMEREGDIFHQNVRDAYRALSQEYGWALVDASGSPEEVFAQVTDLIEPILPGKA
jgi:dTMP kinase